VRSVLIDVGGGGFVHAYQVPEGQIPLAGQPKYQRGHVDHIGLAAPTQEAFLAVRRRAMEVGATDGRVRDFGAAWGMKFRDPDGMQGDLMWADPDAPLTAFRQYADAPVGAALSTPTSPPVIGTSALPPVLSTTGGGQRPIRAFRTTGCG